MSNYDDNFEQELKNLVQDYEQGLENDVPPFHDEETYEQIIEYYEDANQLEKANNVCDIALQHYAFSSELMIRKANLLILEKKFTEALIWIERARSFDPQNMSIYILCSDIYLDEGQPKKAVQSLEQAMKVADENDLPDLFLEIAEVYESSDQYDKALDAVANALKLDPFHQEALHKIWFIVEVTKQFEKSIAIHEEVIERDPYSYLAWYNLAQGYEGLHYYDEAIDAYEFVMAINERFDLAYKECGELYRKLGKLEKAIELLTKALRISVHLDDISLSLAKVYQEMNNMKMAIFYFKKVVRYDKMNDEAWFELGNCYKDLCQWEEAEKAYKQAMKINDKTADYALRMSDVYYLTGKTNKAIELLTEPVKKTGHQACLMNLVMYMLETNKETECLQLLELVETKHKDIKHTAYFKAAAFLMLNDQENANKSFQNALEENFQIHPLLFKLLPGLSESEEIKKIADQFKR